MVAARREEAFQEGGAVGAAEEDGTGQGALGLVGAEVEGDASVGGSVPSGVAVEQAGVDGGEVPAGGPGAAAGSRRGPRSGAHADSRVGPRSVPRSPGQCPEVLRLPGRVEVPAWRRTRVRSSSAPAPSTRTPEAVTVVRPVSVSRRVRPV